MNEFDFEICYKKGSKMPADFLSQNAVDAINLYMSLLAHSQDADPTLKALKNFLLSKQLPFEPTLRNLIFQLSLQSFIEDGILWTRLKNTPEKRVVIMAPADIIPDILSDAHGHILAGHNGVLKRTHFAIILLAGNGPRYSTSHSEMSSMSTSKTFSIATSADVAAAAVLRAEPADPL
jgi:hypothetical protein